MSKSIPEMLASVGLTGQSLEKIRFAKGVVGKNSYIAGITIFSLLAIAYRITNEIILTGFGVAILGLFIWYVKCTQKFAKENPSLALLEGAELLIWKQVELAAQGIPNPPSNDPLLSAPTNTTLLSIPPHENDEQ